jgi:hypothetical protein
MSIPFTCPHCGEQTLVEDKYAGQSGPCIRCGKPITVPLTRGPGDVAPQQRVVISSGASTGVMIGCIMFAVVMFVMISIFTSLAWWLW